MNNITVSYVVGWLVHWLKNTVPVKHLYE